MSRCSLRSTAALSRRSGLTASLPRLSHPDPLWLSDGHHQRAAPTVAPNPDVHLVESAAVAPVPLCVSRGASKTQIVLEAMWNRGASNEALNEGCSPQHVCHRAAWDVEAGQTRVAGRVVKHGDSSSLHDGVSSMALGSNVLKYTRDTSL